MILNIDFDTDFHCTVCHANIMYVGTYNYSVIIKCNSSRLNPQTAVFRHNTKNFTILSKKYSDEITYHDEK